MSRPRSDSLRAALRELAEADVEAVLALAREGARNRARALVEDALVEELLEAVRRRSTGAESPRRKSRPAADPAETPARDRAAETWWTYCVVSASDAERIPPELEGVEPGSAVEIVREGQLAALVSAVPAEEYDDDRLRDHLEDLEWVDRTARRHESVLETALEQVTLVPLRLCTIYNDLAGVRRLLREQEVPLARGLAKVEGCTEWGVKVFAGEVEASGADGPPGETTAGPPGATYLLHRRREREQAGRASELRAACAQAVHDRVALCAREAIANPPQRPELHGRDMTMVLNGAYLVAREHEQDLHEAMRSLQQGEWVPKGFVIELTGPWPPYNFVSDTAGMVT